MGGGVNESESVISFSGLNEKYVLLPRQGDLPEIAAIDL